MGTNRSAKNPGVAIMLESEILFGSPRARLAQSAMPEKEANFYTFLGGLQESLGDDRRDTYLLAKRPFFYRRATDLLLKAAAIPLKKLTAGSPEKQEPYRRLAYNYDGRAHGRAAFARELSNAGPVIYVTNNSKAPRAMLDAAYALSLSDESTRNGLDREPLFGHAIMAVVVAGDASKDQADDIAKEAMRKGFEDRSHIPLVSDGSQLQGAMSRIRVERAGLDMSVLPLPGVNHEAGITIGRLFIGMYGGLPENSIKRT